MKQIITIILIAITVMLFSESIEVSGPLGNNNVWQADTVFVVGNINLDRGAHLTIEPGTYVIFNENTSFTSEGFITATGEPQDSIRFVSQSADGWNGIRMIGASGTFSYCVFENVNGFNDPYYYIGGAILARDTSYLSLDNCRFSGNNAYCGGGLSVLLSDCEITNCVFTGNETELDGGAIYVELSSLSLDNCRIANNDALEGAGVLLSECWDLVTISNCQLQSNIAPGAGGGVLALNCVLQFDNCDFIGNSSDLNGGAVSLDFCETDFSGCRFEDNYGYQGGCIQVLWGSYSIESCEFLQNSAGKGGCVYIHYINSNHSIVNCLFAGNEASYGGVFFGEATNTISFFSCTFADNEALLGGVYYSERTTSYFYNSLIWGNTASDDCFYYQENETTGKPSFYYCLLQDGINGVGGTAIVPDDIEHENIIVGDPLFDSSSEYPYNIIAGSIAIDSGTPNIDHYESTPLDLAGFDRIVNDRIDIGCYENQNPWDAPLEITNPDHGITISMMNPYRPGSSISLSIANPGNVELVIYNVKGQRVRALYNDTFDAQRNQPITWNGTDDRNQPVASGVYFCMAKYAGRTQAQKLLLVR